MIVQTVVVNTTALQTVTNQVDVGFRNDTVVAESRVIQVVFVNPDGKETSVLSGAPEELDGLLAELRRNKYLNGRYRVYLTEMNLADKKVIEHRELMAIYKSGTRLGEQVHEPGPGDNPRDSDGNPENPKTPPAPKVLPQEPPAQTRAGKKQQHAAAEPLPKAVSRPDKAQAPKTKVSHSAVRYSLVGAAAALGGLGAQSLEEAWARRVDQALAGGRGKSSSLAARLSRLLRKSKS